MDNKTITTVVMAVAMMGTHSVYAGMKQALYRTGTVGSFGTAGLLLVNGMQGMVKKTPGMHQRNIAAGFAALALGWALDGKSRQPAVTAAQQAALENAQLNQENQRLSAQLAAAARQKAEQDQAEKNKPLPAIALRGLGEAGGAFVSDAGGFAWTLVAGVCSAVAQKLKKR